MDILFKLDPPAGAECTHSEPAPQSESECGLHEYLDAVNHLHGNNTTGAAQRHADVATYICMYHTPADSTTPLFVIGKHISANNLSPIAAAADKLRFALNKHRRAALCALSKVVSRSAKNVSG